MHRFWQFSPHYSVLHCPSATTVSSACSFFFLAPSFFGLHLYVANLNQHLIMVKISESIDEEHNLFLLTVAVNQNVFLYPII